MKNNVEKKQISLNRTLLLVIVVIYSSFLLLLSCMDSYLIISYQRSLKQEQIKIVEDVGSAITYDMEKINFAMYDNYAYNLDFIKLGGDLTREEAYTHLYQLDENWTARVTIDQELDGYIVYQSSFDDVRYHRNETVIDTDDMKKIRQMISSLNLEENFSNKWIVTQINYHDYALCIQKKKNVVQSSIYSIEKWKKQLILESGYAENVFVLEKGLSTGENTEQSALYQAIKDNYGSFGIYQNGTYYYGIYVTDLKIWLCMAVPATIFSYLNIPILLLLIFTAACMVIAVVGYYLLKKELLLPLKNIVSYMNEVRAGEENPKIMQSSRFMEIQRINDTMELMMNEVKKNKMLAYEQTIEQQKARMQYLQLQLKPHFYLNGLKTLNVLAINKDTDHMQDLIMNLSYHLRNLLQAERETVELHKEIDFVNNYVELQRNMTGRIFEVVWDVQVKDKNIEVPNLCIQTFVENSVKYARLGSIHVSLKIWIQINALDTEEGTFLDILIRDNGCGYPDDILDAINSEKLEENYNIGINNLRRRCNLLYDGKAEFDFYNDNGAVSNMILPEKGKKHEAIDCG